MLDLQKKILFKYFLRGYIVSFGVVWNTPEPSTYNTLPDPHRPTAFILHLPYAHTTDHPAQHHPRPDTTRTVKVTIFYPFKNVSNALLWHCTQIVLKYIKRSEVPQTKLVTLTVHMNKVLQILTRSTNLEPHPTPNWWSLLHEQDQQMAYLAKNSERSS